MTPSSKKKLFTRDFLFLMSCVFFAASAHAPFMATFPIYILELGGSHSLTGMMITGQVIAGIVTRLLCGPLQDRYGRRNMMIIGAVMFTMNLTAFVFVRNLPGAFVLRVLMGVSQGVYFGSAGTFVADIVPHDKLVDGVGLFSVMGPVSSAFTPMLALYIFQHHGSSVMFIFIAAAAAISAVFPILIANKYTPAPQPPRTKGEKPRGASFSTFVELSIIVPALISFFVMFSTSAASNFLTAFGVERGLGSIGLYFTANSIAIIIIRMCLGAVMKKTGQIPLIFAGSVSLVASGLFIAFAYSTVPIIAAGVCSGISMGFMLPILNSLAFQIAPPERKGVANSNYLLMNDMGGGLGASFWGMTTQNAGYTVTYVLAAVCGAVSVLIHGFFLTPKIKKITNIRS